MALRKTNVFTPLVQYLADFTSCNITVKTLLNANRFLPTHLPPNADGWECILVEDPEGEVSLRITNKGWGGVYEVKCRLPKRNGRFVQPPPFPVRKRTL